MCSAVGWMIPGAAAAEAEGDATRQRVHELRREIARHDELYFRAAAPEISDEAYDRLRRELTELEAKLPPSERASGPGAPVIGDDRMPGFARAEHHEPMLSLEKAYTDDALAAFVDGVAERLRESGRLDFLVEPKLDGIAIGMTYASGRLVRALSRGNGREGDDLTASVRAIGKVPEQLAASADDPWPALIEVRGEVFLPREAFDRLNAARVAAGEVPFAHPRNVAAGTVRLEDAEEIARRGLAIVCHGVGLIEPESARPPAQSELYERFRRWGLPVVDFDRVPARADLVVRSVTARQRNQHDQPYPSDGVVVKLDRFEHQRTLGSGPAAPRWAIARKFSNEQVTTIVRRVIWQPGRSGRLTPVAEVDPVQVSGSTVTRVTLHNAAELGRLDLHLGDAIVLERAGGVIPSVVSVMTAARPSGAKPVDVPSVCPSCSRALAAAAEPECRARDCPARLQRRIEHFSSRSGLDIAGLGPDLIEHLVQEGRLRSIADLYSFSRDEWADAGRADVFEALRRTHQAPVENWIAALGFSGIGRVRARQLAQHFRDLEELQRATPEELEAAGLGASSAAALHRALAEAEFVALLDVLRASGDPPE